MSTAAVLEAIENGLRGNRLVDYRANKNHIQINTVSLYDIESIGTFLHNKPVTSLSKQVFPGFGWQVVQWASEYGQGRQSDPSCEPKMTNGIFSNNDLHCI